MFDEHLRQSTDHRTIEINQLAKARSRLVIMPWNRVHIEVSIVQLFQFKQVELLLFVQHHQMIQSVGNNSSRLGEDRILSNDYLQMRYSGCSKFDLVNAINVFLKINAQRTAHQLLFPLHIIDPSLSA